jgi:hypothetical protein
LRLGEARDKALAVFVGEAPDDVEAALVNAFYDSKVKTEGKCRAFYEHNMRVAIDNYLWDPDRIRVGWTLDPNLDCLEWSDDGKQYLFVEIYVDRRDLENWLGKQRTADREPPTADADRTIPSADAEHAVEAAHRRASHAPSREKPFWTVARQIGREWLIQNGCPESGDGNQAELERYVTTWLEGKGHQASESAVRRHVARWIEERRNDLKS